MKRRTMWVGAVLAALIVPVVFVTARPGTMHVTIDFSDTQGLYAGNEVRVLGVKVGKVESVEPHGTYVTVRASVERSVRLPADASAVIIAPNLVGGRYVQLAPVYTAGKAMSDGDHIPLARTAVPVKWDEIKKELTRLTQALGTSQGGGRAPLSELIHGTAQVVSGNGAEFAKSIREVSNAAAVLAAGTPDLLTTVRNLNVLVDGLNTSDAQILVFARELRAVSDVLSENQNRLRELLSSVSRTVTTLKTFTTQNRRQLRIAVHRVTGVVSDLDKLKVDIANILHLAPNTLANLYNIYDPTSGAFTGRPILGYGAALSNVLCQAIYSAGGSLADCRRALGPVLDQFNLGDVPVGISALEQHGATNQGPKQ